MDHAAHHLVHGGGLVVLEDRPGLGIQTVDQDLPVLPASSTLGISIDPTSLKLLTRFGCTLHKAYGTLQIYSVDKSR